MIATQLTLTNCFNSGGNRDINIACLLALRCVYMVKCFLQIHMKLCPCTCFKHKHDQEKNLSMSSNKFYGSNKYWKEFEFEFWCLMPLSAIFQLYHGDQF